MSYHFNRPCKGIGPLYESLVELCVASAWYEVFQTVWGDDSVGEVLVTQAREPRFGYPALTWKAGLAPTDTSNARAKAGQDNRTPWVCWPESLGKSGSFSFSERICHKNLRWRVLERWFSGAEDHWGSRIKSQHPMISHMVTHNCLSLSLGFCFVISSIPAHRV